MKTKKITSIMTCFVFLLSHFTFAPQNFAHAQALSGNSEVNVTLPFELEVPAKFGTIETVIQGRDFFSETGGVRSNTPTLIHIQEAHGNYEVQKNIESILKHLKDKYEINKVFVEGTAYELEPKLLNFFPEKQNLNLEIAEDLVKKGIVSGPELFLFKEGEAAGYGIEEVGSYIQNGADFKAVLSQREKSQKFLDHMNVQIERLTSPYLNKDLRHFLNRLEDFESELVPFDRWLEEIRGYAEKHLEVDLTNPWFQVNWPMLLRIFTLEKIQSTFNQSAFRKEKKNFLKAISNISPEVFEEVERLLSSSLTGHRLADPETSLLFERMISLLPDNFDYEAYPNVNLFIGRLILSSELKGDRLLKEVNTLADEISIALSENDKEKEIVELLKAHRALNRLFALELTPEDYDLILEERSALEPSSFMPRFLELNEEGRVKNAEFKNMATVDVLFETALSFYEGAKERDERMIQNVERMLETSVVEGTQPKAVVITGGFHSGPFQSYFERRGFHYALITPKMSEVKGQENYVQSILKTFDSPLLERRATYAPVSRGTTPLMKRVGLGGFSVADEEQVAKSVATIARTGRVSVKRVNAALSTNRFDLPENNALDLVARNGSTTSNFAAQVEGVLPSAEEIFTELSAAIASASSESRVMGEFSQKLDGLITESEFKSALERFRKATKRQATPELMEELWRIYNNEPRTGNVKIRDREARRLIDAIGIGETYEFFQILEFLPDYLRGLSKTSSSSESRTLSEDLRRYQRGRASVEEVFTLLVRGEIKEGERVAINNRRDAIITQERSEEAQVGALKGFRPSEEGSGGFTIVFIDDRDGLEANVNLVRGASIEPAALQQAKRDAWNALPWWKKNRMKESDLIGGLERFKAATDREPTPELFEEIWRISIELPRETDIEISDAEAKRLYRVVAREESGTLYPAIVRNMASYLESLNEESTSSESRALVPATNSRQMIDDFIAANSELDLGTLAVVLQRIRDDILKRGESFVESLAGVYAREGLEVRASWLERMRSGADEVVAYAAILELKEASAGFAGELSSYDLDEFYTEREVQTMRDVLEVLRPLSRYRNGSLERAAREERERAARKPFGRSFQRGGGDSSETRIVYKDEFINFSDGEERLRVRTSLLGNNVQVQVFEEGAEQPIVTVEVSNSRQGEDSYFHGYVALLIKNRITKDDLEDLAKIFQRNFQYRGLSGRFAKRVFVGPAPWKMVQEAEQQLTDYYIEMETSVEQTNEPNSIQLEILYLTKNTKKSIYVEVSGIAGQESSPEDIGSGFSEEVLTKLNNEWSEASYPELLQGVRDHFESLGNNMNARVIDYSRSESRALAPAINSEQTIQDFIDANPGVERAALIEILEQIRVRVLENSEGYRKQIAGAFREEAQLWLEKVRSEEVEVAYAALLELQRASKNYAALLAGFYANELLESSRDMMYEVVTLLEPLNNYLNFQANFQKIKNLEMPERKGKSISKEELAKLPEPWQVKAGYALLNSSELAHLDASIDSRGDGFVRFSFSLPRSPQRKIGFEFQRSDLEGGFAGQSSEGYIGEAFIYFDPDNSDWILEEFLESNPAERTGAVRTERLDDVNDTNQLALEVLKLVIKEEKAIVDLKLPVELPRVDSEEVIQSFIESNRGVERDRLLEILEVIQRKLLVSVPSSDLDSVASLFAGTFNGMFSARGRGKRAKARWLERLRSDEPGVAEAALLELANDAQLIPDEAWVSREIASFDSEYLEGDLNIMLNVKRALRPLEEYLDSVTSSETRAQMSRRGFLGLGVAGVAVIAFSNWLGSNNIPEREVSRRFDVPALLPENLESLDLLSITDLDFKLKYAEFLNLFEKGLVDKGLVDADRSFNGTSREYVEELADFLKLTEPDDYSPAMIIGDLSYWAERLGEVGEIGSNEVVYSDGSQFPLYSRVNIETYFVIRYLVREGAHAYGANLAEQGDVSFYANRIVLERSMSAILNDRAFRARITYRPKKSESRSVRKLLEESLPTEVVVREDNGNDLTLNVKLEKSSRGENSYRLEFIGSDINDQTEDRPRLMGRIDFLIRENQLIFEANDDNLSIPSRSYPFERTPMRITLFSTAVEAAKKAGGTSVQVVTSDFLLDKVGLDIFGFTPDIFERKEKDGLFGERQVYYAATSDISDVTLPGLRETVKRLSPEQIFPDTLGFRRVFQENLPSEVDVRKGDDFLSYGVRFEQPNPAFRNYKLEFVNIDLEVIGVLYFSFLLEGEKSIFRAGINDTYASQSFNSSDEAFMRGALFETALRAAKESGLTHVRIEEGENLIGVDLSVYGLTPEVFSAQGSDGDARRVANLSMSEITLPDQTSQPKSFNRNKPFQRMFQLDRSETRIDLNSVRTLATAQTQLLVPTHIQATVGAATFQQVVADLTGELNPVPFAGDTSFSPALEALITQENTPILYRLLNTPFAERQIFDDLVDLEVAALESSSVVDIALLSLLLRRQGQFSYTPLVVDEAAKGALENALQAPGLVSQLGFNPTTSLPNLKVRAIGDDDDKAAADYVSKSFTGKMAPTGLVSRRESLLNRFPVMQNWVPLLEKNPELHSDTLLIFAMLIDQLAKDMLTRHDDESLRAFSDAEALAEEIKLVRAVLAAA